MLGVGRRGRVIYGRVGFTLTELLIAVAVFALVMALLGLPLFAAFGYVQKAMARSEAQRAGSKAVRLLTQDLSTAQYIFDIPTDGSWVAFVKEASPDTGQKAVGDYSTSEAWQILSYSGSDLDQLARKDRFLAGAQGMPMDFAQKVTLIRYAQVPAFPWTWGKDPVSNKDAWLLLAPEHLKNTALLPTDACLTQESYEAHYSPYHDANRQGLPANPYVITRLEKQDFSRDEAITAAQNGRYPLDEETRTLYGADPSTTNQRQAREQLLRRLHNRLPSITPYGADTWDAPTFRVTPLHVTSEALTPDRLPDGRIDPTTFSASKPLWAGRNQDMDVADATGFARAYLPVATSYNSAQIWTLAETVAPLYPQGRNPFGYQIRIFDSNGLLQYGTSKFNPKTKTASFVCQRHFQDWPLIDRSPELTTASLDPTIIIKDRYVPETYTAIADQAAVQQAIQRVIARQRLEGKLVFAQPVAPEKLVFVNYDPADVNGYELPRPKGATWDGARLVSLPTRLTLKQGATKKVFKYVDKEQADLQPDEYTRLKVSGPPVLCRSVYFGQPLNGEWQVVYAALEDDGSLSYTGSLPPPLPVGLYTLCDLQVVSQLNKSGDTVVATYSTKAVLDVTMAVSRKDYAASSPAASRQDYSANLRIEARNALKRARDE